ncbi:alkaline phosphatase [Nostocaceae cyanobacterium CENA369]|uniref:Alkaline phosphatase n=1 Tax=Dendronalium phyllosphericum CENA369 TaxID=1725256 RepID=A0A8J7IDB1_9NOST|nr:alkaline phosphatase [Dendronalium phyllosphericum]MBH8577403.1 alkaline phosphatase [Dendronalium phyllosphericum CENA369]
MISLLRKYKRFLALTMAGLLCTVLLVFGNSVFQPTLAAGNGINVIIMIGDGMGWNMARAGALAKGAPFYTSGKGSGLSFQNLTGYGLVTTYGTTIQGNTPENPKDQPHLTGNSALDGSDPLTGASPVRPNFSFKPTPFNPGDRLDGNSLADGNLTGYDPNKGGPVPWIPLTPANPGSYDKEYIKHSYPDSANTATTLYTGVKSYNNAMGVDIYEKKLKTVLEIAKEKGKSTGLVTSVPVSHATPGAAASFVNRRSKYDSKYDPSKTNQDSILQQTLLNFQPNVLLGGGHPKDFDNKDSTSSAEGVFNYVYITEDTYTHLKNNPTSNRYGYTFLERGPNATQKLLNTAAKIDPNKGGKLFGLYGARGQEGNLPTSSSKGDYSLTGLNNASLYSSVVKAATPCPSGQIIPGTAADCVPVIDAAGNPTSGPTPDTVRPLAPGETDASFIAREVNENPTLADLTKAALTVLGKDKDGFWLMVEGGDIDWSAHDDNMDNLIGTMNDFDKAVQQVITWINNNGGWSKNLLLVTADHDHYLTLNDDFVSKLTPNPDPSKARGLKYNAKDITFNKHNPKDAGHFWGADPKYKYLWGSHSRRIVPVYYQGAYSSTLTRYLGQNVQFTDSSGTYTAPGVRGVVDQSHLFQTMKTALTGSPLS